jgi:NitT/TauT family transport system permease protein
MSQATLPQRNLWPTARRVVLPLIWFAGFLLLWQAIVDIAHIPELILPAPSAFLPRIVSSFDRIWPQAVDSTELILAGFLIGALPAIPLGFLIATYTSLERTLYPFLVFLNVVPKVALIPVLLVWFGFGGAPKIIVAALLVFFPVLVDSISGFRATDRRLFYLSRSMGASELQTLVYIRIPAAMHFIFSGLKISAVLAVTVVIVTEFVGSNAGLGYLILRSTSNHDLAMTFATLFVAAAIGLALSFLVGSFERVLAPWTVHINQKHESKGGN